MLPSRTSLGKRRQSVDEIMNAVDIVAGYGEACQRGNMFVEFVELGFGLSVIDDPVLHALFSARQTRLVL